MKNFKFMAPVILLALVATAPASDDVIKDPNLRQRIIELETKTDSLEERIKSLEGTRAGKAVCKATCLKYSIQFATSDGYRLGGTIHWPAINMRSAATMSQAFLLLGKDCQSMCDSDRGMGYCGLYLNAPALVGDVKEVPLPNATVSNACSSD